MSTNALDLSTLDRAICGEIYASDAAVRNLERLCQECSGRFAGSDDYRRAAEMVAELVARLRTEQMCIWSRSPSRPGRAAAPA